MNFEKYIGIPYAEKGRDETGLDCWGLVRLVYKNELNIDLPSFSAEYDTSDNERLEELFAQYKEGWESTDTAEIGDVVIFRIFGYESHIGVCVGDNKFLHVREARDSVIESLDNPKWSRRITGFFKYSEKKNAVLNTVPHPLRTERYTLAIVPGTTVTELVKDISTKYSIAVELKSRISILINGRVIAQENWNDTVIKESDVIEYRAVPGKDTLRTLAILAVAFYAPQLASMAWTAAGGVTLGVQLGAAVYYGTYAAAMLVGSALINAIAPIRQPSLGSQKDPGSAERQLMVNGGSNRANPYGAIPVVLGKVRMTPLLGSTNFLTYENERDSYLSMLLVWGYGPLSIDNNSYKIGDVPLSSFTDYQKITLERKTEPTDSLKNAFDAIYGKDIDQVNTQVPLVCNGSQDDQAVISTAYSSWNQSTNTTSISDSFTSTKGFSVGQRVLTTITTSSQNNSSWNVTTSGLTNVVISTGNYYKIIIDGVIADSSAGYSCSINQQVYANSTSQTNGTSPGPWFEAATEQQINPSTLLVDKVNSVTLALHFPQGLRKIKVQNSNSGSSAVASVYFRVEYSTDNGTSWGLFDSFKIGGDSVKKDAFTFTKTFSNLFFDKLLVRARRETGEQEESNDSDFRYYSTAILQNVTFSRNNLPAIDPVGSKIAKTAFKIKATDQLNGSIQGISAVVQTYCKIWNGTSWVDGATSNPAALMRYILEHPANPKKVTNAASQINLTQLQYFYNYCQSKGFEYNGVLGEARSVLEVIRDICAAGRASPALVDGKWSVVIDEVKPNVVQHFTPHNSWNFEGSKALPKRPDGLRVTYYDQDHDYQESEIIVYDIGKNSTNASLFESITLPGVTKKSLVIDHAKWHMAQMKLRPELYTLESDIEYLVCNRGDRVKVMHDVPMWGLGSGRIKNRISSTVLELDEDVPMQANAEYTIRFRSKTGASVTRNIVPKTLDGNYNNITLTSAVTTEEVDVLDLFLFGELNQESQDLIVLSIEPTNNNGARITLVDYGVTDAYNIFTDYLNFSEDTVFESQITLPPVLQVQGFGDKVPLITGFVSDESVMERVSKGVFKYNINVAYFNASQLPDIVESVEVQYDLIDSTTGVNYRSVFVPYQNSSANITDVKEGETYKIRMRYIGRNGIAGNWTSYSNHTVVGKTNPPSSVTGFSITSDKASGKLLLSWNNNPEIDTSTYEVRTQDSGWGENDSGRVFYGDVNSFLLKPSSESDIVTYYVKAVDTSGNYSVESTFVVYERQVVPTVSNVRNTAFADSLTNSSLTLEWDAVENSEFNVDYYEISYDDVVINSRSNSVIIPATANWIGAKVFNIRTIDINNKASAYFPKSIEKYRPANISYFQTQVIDNTVMFYWTLPAKTSLPIDHVLLKRGATWETAQVIGEKKGNFTTVNEISGAMNNYWIVCVDTSGVQSLTPKRTTEIVGQPPDFVFHGVLESNFASTKSSAVISNESLVLPVNTTETFEQHFTTRGWTGPSAQVNASYPIFIQPTVNSSYYEEVFDFEKDFQSSRVSLIFNGVILAGNPVVNTKIALSLDNSSFVEYNGVTQTFGVNFRYVKITIEVTSSDPTSLYQISNLSVKLDAKLINDAGNVQSSLTDTFGTIVNFNKEFVDVQSITVSPSGTTAIIPVYNFKDVFASGTYSVSSNVCTVTSNNHDLITGQDVKLSINNGSGISGIYRITSHTINSFTIQMNTADTTGGCSLYPQSFRIYLFDTSGTRVTSTTSWSIKGY